MGTLQGYDSDEFINELANQNSPFNSNITTYYEDENRPNVDEELPDEEFFTYTKSHNVCGPGYYVLSPIWRELNPDDETPGWGCNSCPSNVNDDDFNIEESNLPDPAPNVDDLTAMCSENITTWFPKQYELDVNDDNRTNSANINWTSIATVTDNGLLVTNEDLYKKWFDDRERLSESDLQNFYRSSQYGESLDEFKQEISGTRGSIVPCSETTDDRLPDNVLDDIPEENLVQLTCSDDDTFGTDNIIMDEYIDWRDNRFDNIVSDSSSPSALSIQQLGSSLISPNENFEACVNDLLDENTNLEDRELISDIYAIQQSGDITGLEPKHVRFIKRKLQMLLVDSHRQGLLNCIDRHIYVDETICDQGLTEQMSSILQILFSVIGFNFNLNELSNNDIDKKDHLVMLIDEIGDLIPLALERIIDLSEELEIDHCDGRISNKSVVLRDLYNRVFTSDQTVIDFNTGISDLISNSTPTEFNRSTIIATLGIAFLKYF